MISSIRKSIIQIDALIDHYTLGTLVIEGEYAYLDLSNNKTIELNDIFVIEIILKNGSGYYSISYQEAINTKDEYICGIRVSH